MALNGNEGSYITQAQAKTLGNNYVASDRYAESAGIIAHFLGKTKLLAILNQDGCVGLRTYYGTKDATSTAVPKPEIIVVGTDADGNDILDNGLILDVSYPCPNTCPEAGKGLMD